MHQDARECSTLRFTMPGFPIVSLLGLVLADQPVGELVHLAVELLAGRLRRQAPDRELDLLGELTRQPARSEEHTSELQSRENLVCRLLHEKKKSTFRRIHANR